MRRVQCHAARFAALRAKPRRMPCMNTSSDIQADVRTSDPTGLHRVLDDGAVLPQAARRLDTRAELWPDEVRIRVERLNLDAASFRQLERKHTQYGEKHGDAVRAEVLDIVATRGKMQNPETGSGGMLVGTVEEVGPESPLGLAVGDRVATLVSLTLTPLVIEDGLARWDGDSEQVPCDGYAVLFGRSIAAVIPDDLDPALSLSVMDVCGAPALTARVVEEYVARGQARLPQPGRRPQGRRLPHDRRRAPRGRARPPHRRRPRRRRRGLRRPRPDRAAGRRHRRRRAGRRHRRVRRRPRVRGRRDPRHRRGWHRDLLLHGHQLQRRRPGRRGPGRRRADARRQRLRPRPRGLRDGAAAWRRRCPRTLRAEDLTWPAPRARSASTAATYAVPARWPARSASRSSTSPSATRR